MSVLKEEGVVTLAGFWKAVQLGRMLWNALE